MVDDHGTCAKRNGKAPLHGRLRPADDLFDAPPPHDSEAEQTVLASVLYNPSIFAAVAKIVSADHFHVPPYHRVFEAMAAVHRDGALPAVAIVAGRLRADGAQHLLVELAELAETASTSANGVYAAEIVAKKAEQRRLKLAGMELIKHAYDDHMAVGDFADWRAGAAEIARRIAAPDAGAATRARRPAPTIEPYQPFPVEALPEPISGFVVAGAKAIGCDASYIALPLLSELAAAVGNSRRIRLKRGWEEPSIVWTAIVAESGTAKSPAQVLAMRPIEAVQHRALLAHQSAVEDHERAKLEYERDLASWKKTKGRSEPPAKPEEPVPERYVCDDTTVEALAPLLRHQPRGLLMVKDELAGWLASFDRYSGSGKGGADVAKWLELFGARRLLVDRKSGTRPTIYIQRASVSVAGGIQPGTLRRSLTADYFSNGLAARMLVAWPPRKPKQWTEAYVTHDVEAAVVGVVERLLALPPEVDAHGDHRPVDLPLSDSGKAAWITFFHEHAAEQVELAGDLAAAWSKLEGYTARLALIVHCVRQVAGDPTLRSPDVVDDASIASGVTLARWFGGEAKRVYAMLRESDAEAHDRELLEWIRQKGGEVTIRQVQQGYRCYRTAAADAEAALAVLVEAGLGTWENHHPPSGPVARVFKAVNTSTVYGFPSKPGKNGEPVDSRQGESAGE